MTSQPVVVSVRSVDTEHGPGARIRARRKSLGMAAIRLAKEAEVSREYLSAVENGHNEPSEEWVRRAELAMDRFARETGQAPSDPEDSSEPAAAPEVMRLTFHGIYGIGEIIAEGPVDKPDELVAAVAKLLAEIREKGQQ